MGGLKVPSFLRRKSNSNQRLENMESHESLSSSKKMEEAPPANDNKPEVTASIAIPEKKSNRRIRTTSACGSSSVHSCHSDSTPRSKRFPNFSAGSSFSGDSIVHHLDKLSERDQVWFQAYRFGGR